MLNLYCALIMFKRWTFYQIPEEFQDAVKDRLFKVGYDVNGERLA